MKPVKRIPSYDYKARFNDLSEKHAVLKEKYAQVEAKVDEADRMEQELAACQEEVRTNIVIATDLLFCYILLMIVKI